MSASVIVVSLLAAVGLAMVHLFSGKLRFLEGTPAACGSRWQAASRWPTSSSISSILS